MDLRREMRILPQRGSSGNCRWDRAGTGRISVERPASVCYHLVAMERPSVAEQAAPWAESSRSRIGGMPMTSKLLSLFAIFVFCGLVLPGTAAADWYENFDSYALGSG